MSKPNILNREIVVALIVLVVVTITLNVISYQRHFEGKIPSAKQVEVSVQTTEAQTEQIYYFTNSADALNTFPDFDSKVNWDKQAVFGYVSPPQTNTEYRLQLDSTKRTGNYINISYTVITPDGSPTFDLNNLSYPTLFVSVDKDDFVAGSDIYIQFIEKDSGYTKTLRLPPNEI